MGILFVYIMIIFAPFLHFFHLLILHDCCSKKLVESLDSSVAGSKHTVIPKNGNIFKLCLIFTFRISFFA